MTIIVRSTVSLEVYTLIDCAGMTGRTSLQHKAKQELDRGRLSNVRSLLRFFLVQLRLVRRRHVLNHIVVAVLLPHLQEDRVA